MTAASTLGVLSLVAAIAVSGCGDSESDNPDFVAADLEALSLAPGDLPEMEYQPDSSGPGAFAEDQAEEAKEEGERSGLELVEHLESLGLEADYVSQFFATSRDSDLFFVESTSFLFEDEEGAEAAVDLVSDANADNISPAEAIEPPDLGEQPFGARGEFDGFLTYSVGWRIGDVIQVLGVAPGNQHAGPESTLRLAEQLGAKAEEQ